MLYICGVLLVWISTLVTQSEQGVLPLPKKHGRQIIRILNEAPLKTHTHSLDLAQQENTILRKSTVDLGRHFGRSKRYLVLPDRKYDENGMIYLSKPKVDGDRKINELLNKIVKYKTEDEKNDHLRTRLTDLFASEEIEQMENIVSEVGWDYRRINSNENVNTTPRIVFKFSDLVL